MSIRSLAADQHLLETYILEELKRHLKLEDRYSPEFIDWNLPFLLAREDHSAVNWVSFLESNFQIHIPDDEVDYFFFSSVRQMAETIRKYVGELH